MQEISNILPVPGKKRVVIVGGGFGGLKLARKLDTKKFQIVLIDRNNYHLFQPLLYQVATSGIEPSAISFPFRKIFKNRPDFHIRICSAIRAVPRENRLETTIGCISYDILIIATGCDTNFRNNLVLERNSMALKSIPEALANRNHIIESLEKALNTSDETERDRLMTFVIAGGGPTGIELAGTLAEMRKFVLPRDYPELQLQKMKIILIDGAPRLLAAFSERSALKVSHYLALRGVEVHLNCLVKSYENEVLTTVDGTTIETANLFWVAGVKANSLPGFETDSYAKDNRLKVNLYNCVYGYENVYAIGDTAIMSTPDYPAGHPQVVQPAIQQAMTLVRNLNKKDSGNSMQPFKYNNKGSMATIGRNHAIAEIGRIRLSGFLAWAVWLFIHLMSIVGLKNRIFIFIDWMWSYITYDQSLRLLIKKTDKNNPPAKE